MRKYEFRDCEGYWEDDPESIMSVRIALGEWDGIEDDEDQEMFYYMDGAPLTTGAVISDEFVITEVEA